MEQSTDSSTGLKLYLVKRADTPDFGQCKRTMVYAENEDRAAGLATGFYEQGYIDVIEITTDGETCVCGDSPIIEYNGTHLGCPVHGA